MDLGLSDSEEEKEPEPADVTEGDSGPQTGSAQTDDGLGLSDDDEPTIEEKKGPSRPVVHQSDGLGLSDSEDDDAAQPEPKSTIPNRRTDDLGLSDSDAEESSGAAPSRSTNEAEVPEAPTTRPISVAGIARPAAGASVHIAKLPSQFIVEPEEFHYTRTLREMEARVMEARGAELESADADLDAAKNFAERAAQARAPILWRYKRDATGAVEMDSSGEPIRYLV